MKYEVFDDIWWYLYDFTDVNYVAYEVFDDIFMTFLM